MIVPEGGFLLPSSRVPGFVLGGMVLDEIDTCISNSAIQEIITFQNKKIECVFDSLKVMFTQLLRGWLHLYVKGLISAS